MFTTLQSWSPAAAAILGVLFIGVGFFRDPARGRPRCPRCWHPFDRSPQSPCTECGRVPGTERRLYRTRRSGGALVVGFLLVGTALSVYCIPRWIAPRNLPTRVVMWFLSSTDYPWWEEAHRRGGLQALSQSSPTELRRLCAHTLAANAHPRARQSAVSVLSSAYRAGDAAAALHLIDALFDSNSDVSSVALVMTSSSFLAVPPSENMIQYLAERVSNAPPRDRGISNALAILRSIDNTPCNRVQMYVRMADRGDAGLSAFCAQMLARARELDCDLGDVRQLIEGSTIPAALRQELLEAIDARE
jgi:hypothetical protein